MLGTRRHHRGKDQTDSKKVVSSAAAFCNTTQRLRCLIGSKKFKFVLGKKIILILTTILITRNWNSISKHNYQKTGRSAHSVKNVAVLERRRRPNLQIQRKPRATAEARVQEKKNNNQTKPALMATPRCVAVVSANFPSSFEASRTTNPSWIWMNLRPGWITTFRAWCGSSAERSVRHVLPCVIFFFEKARSGVGEKVGAFWWKWAFFWVILPETRWRAGRVGSKSVCIRWDFRAQRFQGKQVQDDRLV